MRKVIEIEPFFTIESIRMFPDVDFADTFSTTNTHNTIDEITQLVFGTSPSWVRVLFAIRNNLVRFIGLSVPKPEEKSVKFEVGAYVRFFKIYYFDKDQVILGANDSHLNFRAIIFNDNTDNYNIKVSTLVKYNNTKGRYYMKFIKPFHKLIIKRMMKNAYSNN